MTITITDDFDLKKIAESGQNFRCRIFDDNTYRFITCEYILYIKQVSDTEYDINCNLDEWKNVWIPYFDLQRNYAQIRGEFD